MALDIIITNKIETIKNSISLTEYYSMAEKISKQRIDYPLLTECFADYYRDFEIFIDQLPQLKKETMDFMHQLDLIEVGKLQNFIDRFLEMIEYAIKNKNTIKFIAD